MPADLTQDILNSDVITLLTRAIPNPELISDTSMNDSNKTLTVPSGQIWEVLWIDAELACTSTVGNRTIGLNIRDDSNVIILGYQARTEVAAGGTDTFLWAPGVPDQDTGNDPERSYRLPNTVLLPAGFNIHIRDSSGIDADADDLHIHMMVNRYDV